MLLLQGGVKAQRKHAFPHKDHAITASEPGVFAQVRSHSGSRRHEDLPLDAHEWKGAEGVRKKWLGPDVNTAKEAAGSPHSFLLCWPKTITLGHFTSGSSDADPQPGRTHLPSDSAWSGDSCLFPAPEGGSQGTVTPQCDSGAGWGGTVVRPPSGTFQRPIRKFKPRMSTITLGLGKNHFPHS